MRVALCVGHSRRGDNGAVAADGSTQEWTFWRRVAHLAKRGRMAYDPQVAVYDVYAGRSYTEAMSDCAARVRDFNADCAIELHFNAYNGIAQGREAFYWHSSPNGESLAKCILEVQERRVAMEGGGFPFRGAKPATRDTRGAQFLRKTHCPAIIWEGWFGDNLQEWAFYSQREDMVADILAECICEWEPYIMT